MRNIIIAGNWKLNNTIQEAIELVTFLKRDLSEVEDCEIVVCPAFTAIAEVSDTLYQSNIKVGGQDLYWEDSGAFTGEVSAPLLKDAGAHYVIIGHSERRQFFSETNQTVNAKIRAALSHSLTPIVCVGESLKEREANQTFHVVERQVKESLAGISEDDMRKIVLAYEPVWAIGTGKTATPDQAQEVHKFIRDLLSEMYNDDLADAITIQYGGSVKPENIRELILKEDIDGALVGGASLKAESFVKIVLNSSGIKKGSLS